MRISDWSSDVCSSDLPGTRLVDAEVVQGLTHVEIGLAGGDDAEAALAVAEHHAVELVGAREGEGGVDLVAVQALLLRQRRVRPADVQDRKSTRLNSSH